MPLPNNTASNVQQARSALGQRLRELRQNADLSGKEFAESLSWPASKVSKLENGRQTPTDEDIHAWTRATGRDDEATALLASLHTLELQYAEWQRVFRHGFGPGQNSLAELEQKTRFIRCFEVGVIPGLLQTAEYARARFAEGSQRLGINDVDEAVLSRVRRQEILYRPDKRFHFVLTEAALRFRLCSPAAMLGQLDRLIPLSQLPNVKLGIIGFETEYQATGPWHGFWLYDDHKVEVETLSAGLDLRQPQEIELYSAAFADLAGMASYGRAARAIITRVIDDLAPDVTEEY